ncbi:hypothetical protein FRC08_003629 [Ceratobasidium sp. 394]|nr:hypothetical protein FRC08_003629 [Ceratobasidium sp. 394]
MASRGNSLESGQLKLWDPAQIPLEHSFIRASLSKFDISKPCSIASYQSSTTLAPRIWWYRFRVRSLGPEELLNPMHSEHGFTTNIWCIVLGMGYPQSIRSTAIAGLSPDQMFPFS